MAKSDPVSEAMLKNIAWNNEHWQEEDRLEAERYAKATPSKFIKADADETSDVESMESDEEAAIHDKAIGPSPFRGRKGLVIEGTKSAGEYSADDLNEHLASGGVVQITTYTNSWVYDKRWAGKFFERDGNLYIRKGNRSEQLSSNGRMLVGIRKGRYQ